MSNINQLGVCDEDSTFPHPELSSCVNWRIIQQVRVLDDAELKALETRTAFVADARGHMEERTVIQVPCDTVLSMIDEIRSSRTSLNRSPGPAES